MLLIALVVVLALALLALGFFAPRLSRRLQGRLDQKAEEAESKAETQPKPVRDGLDRSLELSRKTADRATEAGREGHQEAERAKR